MRINRTHTKGFTLVEMIVALMIFSIVAVVALGALVKIISTNKKAQTLQASITNLNFAMESISRELRVGSKYHCVTSSDGMLVLSNSLNTRLSFQQCSSGNENVIAFESTKLDTQSPNAGCPLVFAYLFRYIAPNQYQLEKAQQAHCGDSFSTNSYTPLVDPNITISNYGMTVSNATYPLFSLYVSGFAGITSKEKEKSYFDLQTSVSARIP